MHEPLSARYVHVYISVYPPEIENWHRNSAREARWRRKLRAREQASAWVREVSE